jgi:hypothetical protein
MTTPQLEGITQLGAGTVKELSQMAVAALVKEDWKGRGIFMAPLKWRPIFQMSMVLEDQIPALIARHLREAKKEKEGFLYGFKTPVLEAGLVEGADTVTVGKDWDLGPQTRRFIPMRVGDTDGRLILSQRDALVLNFKHYSDDRARGTVSNLTLFTFDTFHF